MGVMKIVTHSRKVMEIALECGWHVGARYTNLRDVKSFRDVTFIDINWKDYKFEKHLEAVKQTKPKITVARDILDIKDLEKTLEESYLLRKYCQRVVIVPKAPELIKQMDIIPAEFILGYSVPSKYGKTVIPPSYFGGRRVHLLGGRPDVQRNLAKSMDVISVDCNRFTLDAKFGDYFVGDKFVPHPVGGYENCLRASILNINKLWHGYTGQT